jgi:inorganic triphosphatase YgiF
MLDKSSTEAPMSDAMTDPRISSRPKEEAELKFLVPADAFDRVREAPVMMRHARDSGIARHLETVYFDTAERTLFNHGISLRVRRSGEQFVQTLKRNPEHGKPFVRDEWETPVSSMAPELVSFPIGEIGVPLDTIASNVLGPVFVAKVHRRTQQVDFSGSVLEVAFDEGVIESSRRSEPVTEIEVEAKTGDPLALYDLGLELVEIAPLRIGTQSKSDRGYGLAFGLAPNPTRAAPPVINGEYTVDDVIGVLLGSCQHHLLANQAVAEQGRDPEGVHQMRVALRRMRTIATLFRQQLDLPSLEGFNREAKWLGRLLGAARDWDVFVTDTLRAPSRALGREGEFDSLRRAAEPHRIAAYVSLREAFASPRYNRFQLSLRRWIQARGWRNELRNRSLAALVEPASAFAGRLITQLHRKALKKGRHFRNLQPEALHQVRIALKKLRYATDSFQAAHGGRDEVKGFLACITALQEALGRDNDASMTASLLSTLAQEQQDPNTHRTIGVVIGWQARDRFGHAKTLGKQWDRFKAARPFWSTW